MIAHDIRQDFRWAIRRLAATPGLFLVASLTMALTLGAAATLFSVLNALVLRPLAVREPHRLVFLTLTERRTSKANIPLDTAAELGRSLDAFDVVCPYSTGGVLASKVGTAVYQTPLEAVGPGYFEALGIRPAAGRLLGASGDDFAAGSHVVVLGFGYWQKAFGGDPAVVGSPLNVEGVPLTIVGVAPASYTGISIDVAPDVIVPVATVPELLGMPPDPHRVVRSNYVLARLRPGVSLEGAAAEVAARWPGVRAATVPGGYSPAEQEAYRESELGVSSVTTGISSLRARYEQPLWLVVALAALLVLLACANLSGLLLARAQARRHEFTIAVALGSSPARLIQQVLIEVTVVAAVGGIGALLVAWWASRALAHAIWTGIVPMTLSVSPDLRVLAATAGAVCLASFICGALPAAMAFRRARLPFAARRPAVAGTGRTGRVLVMVQVALSLALIVGAGLFTRSLGRLRAIDPGFRPAGVLAGRLQTQPGAPIAADRSAYLRTLLDRLDAQPGVQSAGLAHLFSAPVTNQQPVSTSETGAGAVSPAAVDQISPGFLDTVGIPLIAGRDFAWTDRAGSQPVAIVSETLARHWFPEGHAVNGRIRVGAGRAAQTVEIVGVAGDARLGDLRKAPGAAVYRPLAQEPRYQAVPVVFIRARGDAHALVEATQTAVASLGVEYAPNLLTLDGHLDRLFLPERLLAAIASTCSGLAAIVGFFGLFALIGHGVASQTREIAVRVALGATRRGILRMVLGRSVGVAAMGVLLGLPLAYGAGRLVGSMLFEISPGDPAVVFLSAAAYVTLGLAAGWMPARSAMRVDPIRALRAD